MSTSGRWPGRSSDPIGRFYKIPTSLGRPCLSIEEIRNHPSAQTGRKVVVAHHGVAAVQVYCHRDCSLIQDVPLLKHVSDDLGFRSLEYGVPYSCRMTIRKTALDQSTKDGITIHKDAVLENRVVRVHISPEHDRLRRVALVLRQRVVH